MASPSQFGLRPAPACAESDSEFQSDLASTERWLRDFVSLIYRQGSLWLFDNPTMGLSESSSKILMDALLDTNDQATVIVATNWDSEIARFDRVVELGDGGVVFDGPSTEWFRQSRSYVRSAFRDQHAHA